jgi:hypothetical protein
MCAHEPDTLAGIVGELARRFGSQQRLFGPLLLLAVSVDIFQQPQIYPTHKADQSNQLQLRFNPFNIWNLGASICFTRSEL